MASCSIISGSLHQRRRTRGRLGGGFDLASRPRQHHHVERHRAQHRRLRGLGVNDIKKTSLLVTLQGQKDSVCALVCLNLVKYWNVRQGLEFTKRITNF
jgi:hypothetical protein